MVSDKSFRGGDLRYTGDSVASTLGLAMYRIRRAGLWNQGDRVFKVILNGSQAVTGFDLLANVASRTLFDEQVPVAATNGRFRFQLVVWSAAAS